MRESNTLAGPSKVLAALIVALATLAIAVGELFIGGAQAMNSSSNPPQPYTNGATVSKVLYPADGSTVTITCTGAVIKQSPGHTAYREGWINPSSIGSINTSSDLKGKLAGGSTNPYGSSNNCPSTSSTTQSSTTTQQQTAQPSPTTTVTPKAQAPTPSASANATANANANVTLAGTNPVATTQAPLATTSTSAAASPAPAQTQTSPSAGPTLPNTGPGNVIAISGVATILGTIGHLLYQRFRYRSLV